MILQVFSLSRERLIPITRNITAVRCQLLILPVGTEAVRSDVAQSAPDHGHLV